MEKHSVNRYFSNPINTIELFNLGIDINKSLFNKTGFFDIKELTPNQKEVDPDHIELKSRKKVKNSTLYVFKINGLNILIDGHHTVCSKISKGITKIKAKYYSYEKL